MGLYSGGLTIGRNLASEIWGANFQEGFLGVGGGRIIGLLWYNTNGNLINPSGRIQIAGFILLANEGSVD